VRRAAVQRLLPRWPSAWRCSPRSTCSGW
jgi:hypothetical protein